MTHSVVIITKGGAVGIAAAGDRVKCDEAVMVIRTAMANPEMSNQKLCLDGGFGHGWPCPVGAISEVVVLGPGEALPDHVIEKAVEMVRQFNQALKNATGTKE